jgi:hypothetical protein
VFVGSGENLSVIVAGGTSTFREFSKLRNERLSVTDENPLALGSAIDGLLGFTRRVCNGSMRRLSLQDFPGNRIRQLLRATGSNLTVNARNLPVDRLPVILRPSILG